MSREEDSWGEGMWVARMDQRVLKMEMKKACLTKGNSSGSIRVLVMNRIEISCTSASGSLKLLA